MLEIHQHISGGYCFYSQMLSTEGSALAIHGLHFSISLVWLLQLMRTRLTRLCSHCYDLAFSNTEFQLIPKHCKYPVLPVSYLSAVPVMMTAPYFKSRVVDYC